MIFMTEMKHLYAVMLDSDVRNVTQELLRLGLLHFINISESVEDLSSKLDVAVQDASQTRIVDLRRRADALLGLAGISPADRVTLDAGDIRAIDIGTAESTLDEVSKRIEVLREQQKTLQTDILRLRDLKQQMELFGGATSLVHLNPRFSFLFVRAGSVPDKDAISLPDALAAFPVVVLREREGTGRTDVFLVAMKRDEAGVMEIVTHLGWQDLEISPDVDRLMPDVDRDLDKKIEALDASQASLAEASKRIVTEKLDAILDIWKNARLNELYNKVQSFYGATSKTKVFSGWLPASKYATVDAAIKRVSENRCYIEWSDPDEIRRRTRKQVTVPVKFSSPGFLSPFHMLVKNYAMPEYGTIDPTPFVSLLYFLMFGLMFADFGHGLVVFLVGLAGTLTLKKKNPGSYSLANILVWCGTSGMLFGALFGSYFGTPLFPPLWFNYHAIVAGHGGGNPVFNDINDILFLTMLFGIAVISLGLLMNWINLVKKRDWAKLFVEKRGLLGGYMYACGIYVCFYMADHGFKTLPPMIELVFMVFLPSFVFFLKSPVEFFIHRKNHPETTKLGAMTIVNFFIEWFVEMLEIYSGYLSNTLSFLRVAALGIAHVSLVVVFDQLSGSAGGLGFIVLLLGHSLIIGLEGLSAGIQSLRLNYYEFFSKFFTGTGVPYAPVTLEYETKVG